MKSNSLRLFVWPICMLLLTVCMFLMPQATYAGARNGLETWALTLVPSLLPFMIVADILIEMGVVSFLGILLEPLMRPLFRLPGAAGFAVAMGFTSGFPMGALLTTSLYEKGLCTKNEATRLVTFTNNASPLFLLVAIPVTMLHAPTLGWTLLAAHYGANLLIGILIGRLGSERTSAASDIPTGHLLARSISAFIDCRRQQSLPLGLIVGNAVSKGIKNILSIGGFVLFFSVVIQILSTIHIIDISNVLFSQLLQLFALDTNLSGSLSTGFLEMTLGAQAAAQSSAPVLQKIMMIGFILGWSGLSIHAQVGSIIAAQKIPLWPYIVCRILQGTLAALLSMVFFALFHQVNAVFQPLPPLPLSPLIDFGIYCQIPLLALLILVTAALIIYALQRIFSHCQKH